MYLFGGYNGSTWLNDLWMFDIDTQKWTCIQESSEGISTSAVVAAPNNNPGQESESSSNSALVQALQRMATQRTVVVGVVPTHRFGYVSVVHNNKFVLFGGFDGVRWLNDMYEFDLQTNVWKRIAARGNLPSVRSCPAWAKDDRYVYIHGVRRIYLLVSLISPHLIYCSRPSLLSLAILSNLWTLFGNKIQGYDGVERKADFFACDLSTYTWTELPCKGTAPSPRYFHSCCIHGNKLYTYGGYNGTDRLADMLAYDFETNHWTEVDCSNGERPSGRSSLVAQVYENCLYIFGGYNGSTVLNDFYKFRLKPVNVPSSALVTDLRQLMMREDLSDVTFVVEGREVHANRSLLAVRSAYFEAMLFGGMSESVRVDRDQQAPIEIHDISHSVFLKVLEYLYTDTVSEVTWDMGMALLIASEQFMLDRLKALCQDRLRRDIAVENVIGVLIASHR